MRLTVLVDNNTFIDRYFYGEPALSFFIELKNKKILFDTGYSDIFIKNARKMNINLLDLDFVVLSHGHPDHTWGLEPLIRLYSEAVQEKIAHKKPLLVAHPDAFLSREGEDGIEIGSLISLDKVSLPFEVILSKTPVWITDDVVFLGEVERKNDFEGKNPMGKIIRAEKREEDYLLDDSALVYKFEKGIVIITGCSHSGICNIIEYAKKICEEERVIDIIGGLHLLNPHKVQLDYTIEYMKTLKPSGLHACHCTDFKSRMALAEIVSFEETGVGLRIEY